MKKFLGILVSVCLLLGLMAIPAAAADGFDWQAEVTFDEEAGTATFSYTPPSGASWVDMFILTSKPSSEGFWDIWNAYGDSTTNGKIKRDQSLYHAESRTVGALNNAEGYDEFEFVPGQTYYAYFATPVGGSAWEISKCFEFTYPGEPEEPVTPSKFFYVDCDTENMTANIYFEPNQGAAWSEMGIYTEPQEGWNANSDGKLVRLANVVPTSLWRVGPGSLTNNAEDGKVDGVQILDSYYNFTVGETYYIYMAYYDGSNWNVVPGYYEFVFEEGAADGAAFDADELILLSDLNNTTITAAAGVGQYSETNFDSFAEGDYRDGFDINVKRAASSIVFDIVNNAGEAGLSFQGYRWNGGTTDGNYYFTGEAEGCDGIYLVSRTGESQRAEVVYANSRYQVIIPEGFDGYLCVPTTRLGNSNAETLVGNYDHSNDEYILYWAPQIYLENRTENASSITLNGFGSLFYKVGEAPIEEPDDPAEEIEALIAQLPDSINATNYTAVKTTLDAINEMLQAHPELDAEYGDVYDAALAEYNLIVPVIEEVNAAFDAMADVGMTEENEADWQEAITALYAIMELAEDEGVDVTGLIDRVDEFAADFEAAYGYAWNTDKPDDNNGDFATLAFALAAVAGSGAIAVRRKRRQ